MRQIALLFFLILLLGCKKEHKEPECRFTKIGKYGQKQTVTYQGDSLVKVGDDRRYSYALYFNTQGRLIRREEPFPRPYYRTDMEYNSSGQVSQVRLYSEQNDVWDDMGKIVYTYANGKIINIKEENAVSQPGNLYDHQVTWEGNNIQSVVHRLNGQTLCTTQFSYDGSIPNRLQHNSHFYFGGGFAIFTYYRDYNFYQLPLYFSELMPSKQVSDCSPWATMGFDYTFTNSGLLESMSYDRNIFWEFEYECR